MIMQLLWEMIFWKKNEAVEVIGFGLAFARVLDVFVSNREPGGAGGRGM